MLRTIAARTVLVSLLFVALEAVVAVPALSMSLALGGFNASIIGAAFVVAAAGIFIVWRLQRRIETWIAFLTAALMRLSAKQWLVAIIGVGAILRVAWALLLPIEQQSDSHTYMHIAEALTAGKPYVEADSGVYWPPGYPFYLSLFMRTGIREPDLVLSTNIVEYIAAIILCYCLARRFISDGGARLATSCFALWPSLITSSGIAQKEQLLIPLLLGVLYLFTARETSALSSCLRWIGCGLLLGCACLVQPSLQLFMFVLILIAVLLSFTVTKTLAALACIVVAAGAVIAPWTIRNYHVLGSFVLVSTNGGDNLYRANNPLATGGYTDHGARDYGNITEVQRNALGTRWALEWIRENPGPFAALALKKQILFLGDDSGGIYDTLRRGMKLEGPAYAIPKIAVQYLWWILWVLIAQRLLLAVRERNYFAESAERIGVQVVAATVLYFWTLHSVFESSGKYHIPAMVVIFILFAAVFEPAPAAVKHRATPAP